MKAKLTDKSANQVNHLSLSPNRVTGIHLRVIVFQFRSPITYFVKNDGPVVSAQEPHNADSGQIYHSGRGIFMLAGHPLSPSQTCLLAILGGCLVIDSLTCGETE